MYVLNNSLRDKFVLINKKYFVEDIMKVVDYYIKRINRRVIFEYVLIDGVNDFIECV